MQYPLSPSLMSEFNSDKRSRVKEPFLGGVVYPFHDRSRRARARWRRQRPPSSPLHLVSSQLRAVSACGDVDVGIVPRRPSLGKILHLRLRSISRKMLRSQPRACSSPDCRDISSLAPTYVAAQISSTSYVQEPSLQVERQYCPRSLA
jgi:hypothetical protein